MAFDCRLIDPLETVDLAYDEFGSQHPTSLIILHGFFASSRNWRKIAEKLAQTYHVYVPDLRNHGASPHHERMDYPTMSADVMLFMDSHKLTSAHIIGHSMGGKVAMWLALNQPARIRKLIVVDIAPKSYNHSFDASINAIMNLPLATIQNRKQAEDWLSKDIPELGYRQFLLQNLILQDGGYQWRIDLAIFKQQAPNIAAFPEMGNVPPYPGETLFVSGSKSNYVTQDDTLRFFPQAEHKVIADAGHWLHVEQPDVFLQEVENFLKSSP